MTEQKLAEWIAANSKGLDEYGLQYNDEVKVTLPMAGVEMNVERLSCDSMKRVFIHMNSTQGQYSTEYSQLTEYLRERISDAVEAMDKD